MRNSVKIDGPVSVAVIMHKEKLEERGVDGIE